MSFSASRLRRTLRSISIGSLLVCAQVRAVVPAVIQRCELDLYLSRAEVGSSRTRLRIPLTSSVTPLVVRPGDPSVTAAWPGAAPADPAGADAASGAVTRRPTARRQCLGSVSGRSTPGEDTSRVYDASPIAAARSSAAESSRLTCAISSRLTPPSASITMRSRRRRPAAVTRTPSRSMPMAVTAGSSRPTIRVGVQRGPALRAGRADATVTRVTAHHDLLARDLCCCPLPASSLTGTRQCRAPLPAGAGQTPAIRRMACWGPGGPRGPDCWRRTRARW